MTRSFNAALAVRANCPLFLSIFGPSGSGKTKSALRLAAGIRSVMGGKIFYIDTESGRALHYADEFEFMHVPFAPPFGPLDYKAAIAYCIEQGATVVVIDSMTHEHSGEGGVLWQSEQQLDRWCTDPATGTYNESKRNNNLARSFIVPKRQRNELNNYILQNGNKCAFIFCYRAGEKLDFKKKENNQPREMGYQPETTSPLMYEMVQQFLLTPGCDGVPTLRPNHSDEAKLVKSPGQFRDWFTQGVQLSEEIGKRFALWAAGNAPAPAPDLRDDADTVIDAINQADTLPRLQSIFKAFTAIRGQYTEADVERIIAAKDGAKERITNG